MSSPSQDNSQTGAISAEPLLRPGLMLEIGEMRREFSEEMKADWETAGDENGKNLAKIPSPH